MDQINDGDPFVSRVNKRLKKLENKIDNIEDQFEQVCESNLIINKLYDLLKRKEKSEGKAFASKTHLSSSNCPTASAS